MSRSVRRQLIRIGRQSGDPATALRFQAVAALAAGRGSVQVARELEIARSTVTTAGRRFMEGGSEALYDQRHRNGVSKVDDAFRQRVAKLLLNTPEDFGWSRPTWTRELLCVQMVREGWPPVAVCTMGRALAVIGARLGVPKPIVLCPWPRDARLRKLARMSSRTKMEGSPRGSDQVS
jgi:hypothetical protein